MGQQFQCMLISGFTYTSVFCCLGVVDGQVSVFLQQLFDIPDHIILRRELGIRGVPVHMVGKSFIVPVPFAPTPLGSQCAGAQ